MMFCKTGTRNARVFPVPVRACARLFERQKMQGISDERVCLHVDSLKSFINSHALHLSHSLQAHVSCDSLDQSIADHRSIGQFLEFGDGSMPSCLLCLVVRGLLLSVDIVLILDLENTGSCMLPQRSFGAKRSCDSTWIATTSEAVLDPRYRSWD